MSRTRIRGANLPVPQSRAQATETMTAIGTVSRQLARLEADMNDQIAAMRNAADAAAEPLRNRRDAMIEGLRLWSEANRDGLTEGGRVKFADLGTGRISWRFRPPSVRLTKIETLLETLKARGLHRFIRVREEPSKEAMLAEPALARSVSGITIGSEGEDFIVEPFEIPLDMIAPKPAPSTLANPTLANPTLANPTFAKPGASG
jgi:phage host-nuclease inhibitor protein Gam